MPSPTRGSRRLQAALDFQNMNRFGTADWIINDLCKEVTKEHNRGASNSAKPKNQKGR